MIVKILDMEHIRTNSCLYYITGKNSRRKLQKLIFVYLRATDHTAGHLTSLVLCPWLVVTLCCFVASVSVRHLSYVIVVRKKGLLDDSERWIGEGGLIVVYPLRGGHFTAAKPPTRWTIVSIFYGENKG